MYAKQRAKLIASDSMMFCLYFLGLCAQFIQLFLEKAGSLNMKFMILITILMTFIYPSAKRSQRQSVSCGGICDFSYSAGLLLYAMFLILKMVYPAMNLVYWLIPAGTVAIINVSLWRCLIVNDIFVHVYILILLIILLQR